MRFELRQTFQLHCRCCRQPWGQKQVSDAAITAVIFGQPYLYAICPRCLQRVSPGDAKDINYRRRYRRILRQRGSLQKCPFCKRMILVHEDGTFAKHRDGLVHPICSGSGRTATGRVRKEKAATPKV